MWFLYLLFFGYSIITCLKFVEKVMNLGMPILEDVYFWLMSFKPWRYIVGIICICILSLYINSWLNLYVPG
jgi:hypothetical protein